MGVLQECTDTVCYRWVCYKYVQIQYVIDGCVTNIYTGTDKCYNYEDHNTLYSAVAGVAVCLCTKIHNQHN